MRTKSLFLIIACVCGAVAAVGASQMMQQQTTPAAIRTTDIFVAARVIEPAEAITAGMMTLQSWPADKVPPGTTNDLTLLEGKFADQRVFTGEPMMIAKLNDGESGISTQIPHGFSVVSMRPDSASSVAGLVRPGDRVNVIGYFTKSNEVPETGVKTVLRGIKVFAVDGQTDREAKPETRATPGTISLLINKEDEEAWMLASELGRIRLSLSAPSAASDSAATRASGTEFLQWLTHRPEPPQPEPAPADPEPSEVTPVTASVIAPPVMPPPLAAPAAERPRGFKMLKLHGENWTEYEIPAGNRPVIVTGNSGSGSMPTAQSEDADDGDNSDVGQNEAAPSPFHESISTTKPDESMLLID